MLSAKIAIKCKTPKSVLPLYYTRTLDYIDPVTISVFWGAEVFNTDTTSALLVDIYYTLHTMYKKGRGTLNCCISLLYSWFMTHLYKEDYMIPNLTKYE